MSLGVAIMASILAAHMTLGSPVPAAEVGAAIDGMRLAFAVAVLFAIAAAVAAWFIRDEDAKATMVRRR